VDEVAIFGNPLKYNVFAARFALIAALMLCLPASLWAKDYKAGEIYTPASWLYGKYVFSVRAAKGSGVLSAFFLWKNGSEAPGAAWEEVDIEIFGKENAEVWQSNIITGTSTDRITSEGTHSHDFSFGDDFHTYTLEWTPDSLIWLVDGIPIRTSNTTTPDSPQVLDLDSPSQLRFNIWASESVEWVGPWNDNILPVFMHVDWVEYYAWDDVGDEFESAPEWRDDFDNFNTSRWSKADWSFDGNRADFIPENAYVQNGLLVLALTAEGGSSSSSSSSSGTGSSSGSGSNSGGSSSSGNSSSGGGSGGCLGLVMVALWYLVSRRRRPGG
jgi:endo-1,3-1,4-beta-glycanase ExoK